jgi:hypothetical protein
MEPNKELVNYIKARKELGGTHVEITNELLGAGWGKNDVELAIKSLEVLDFDVPKKVPEKPVENVVEKTVEKIAEPTQENVVEKKPEQRPEQSSYRVMERTMPPEHKRVVEPIKQKVKPEVSVQPVQTVKTSQAALVLILITVGVAAVGFGLWWYLDHRAPVEQKVGDVATTSDMTNVSTTTTSVTGSTATSSGEVNSNMVHIKGIVVAPKGIVLEKIQIVSLGKTSSVGKDGSFETDVNKDGITSVSAMILDKGFGLMNVVIGDDTKSVVKITTQTTAEAIVFSSPYLMTTSLAEAKEFMGVVKKDPAVAKFTVVIEQTIAKPGDPYKDALFMSTYQKAVDSVLSALES